MLRQRALSALIFVPLFLGLAWLGGIAFDLFLLAVLGFAGFEYARMLQNSGYKVFYPFMIAAIAALALLRMLAIAWLEPLAWVVSLPALRPEASRKSVRLKLPVDGPVLALPVVRPLASR